MRDLLLALIVFGSVPYILVRPYVGVLVWFWLSLMSPHKLTWGFAQTLRIALVVAVVTVASWFFSREPKRLPSNSIVYLLAALTLWVTFTLAFAKKPDLAFEKWDWVIKILGMTFLTMSIVRGKDRIQILVWVIVLSLGFYGVRGGIFSIVTGGNFRVWGPPQTFIEDNNQLALALVMTIPLMRHLQLSTENRWIQIGLWGMIGLTIIAIVGTYSRGGFLALGIMLAYLWVKTRRKVATGAALLVILVGIFAYKPDHWFDRMATITEYQQDESAIQRIEAWTFAWRVALDNPIVGGGLRVFYDGALFKAYVPTAESWRNAHSIYFEVLGETGFVGLAIFLALLAACFFTARRIIRDTRDRPDLAWAASLAAMAQVSVIGYAAAGTFLNLGFFDVYYALLALIAVLQREVQESLRAAPVDSRDVRRSGEAAIAPKASHAARGVAGVT